MIMLKVYDNLIKMKIIKKLKIKIGKIEPLIFESIEDKDGFIGDGNIIRKN
jgi:hypothetical protein